MLFRSDSNKQVTGVVTGTTATGVSATAVGGTVPSCSLTGGGTGYTCSMSSGTTSGTITLTYVGGTIPVSYVFSTPTNLTKETATIQDDKRVADDWQDLRTGYSGGTTTYSETLATPGVGCDTWTNIARVMIGDVEQARDSATVEI